MSEEQQQNQAGFSKIVARQILDSRGYPTVEVDVYVGGENHFRASVPSGASIGSHEAREFRDNVGSEYMGRGVSGAVENINNALGPALIEAGIRPENQGDIDKFLIKTDGTDDKSKFGSNAILGLSMAICKAGAAAKKKPLYQHIAELANNKVLRMPVPVFSAINGGLLARNSLAIEDILIMPTGALNFADAMKMGALTHQALKKVLENKVDKLANGMGDEGGYAPNLKDPRDAIRLIKEAISVAGFSGKIEFALDSAASQFYKEKLYDFDFKNPHSNPEYWMKAEKLAESYCSYMKEQPIASIIDPFDQDDWPIWYKFGLCVNIQVVCDDLTCTNKERLKEAINANVANCMSLKINQIGTVTEAIEAYNLAKKHGWGVIVSNRAGETDETFIADLAVGLGVGQIKCGAPCRSERVAKYNQLLRLEERGKFQYAGSKYRFPWVKNKN